ncbi:hypothetical protein BDF19DRAFT_475501 [Syncephalis fuscata]|nr:hypothetical protein BDF19DRAFT_475501 [Syncephalis fuscata]
MDAIFKYGLGQHDAFKIKGLTISENAIEQGGAYVVNAKYDTAGNRKLNAKVICGKKETTYFPFRLYNDIYTADYDMYATNTLPHPFYSVIKKSFSPSGDYCFMVVEPECNKTIRDYLEEAHRAQVAHKFKFPDLIKIIREMKAKGWLIGGNIDNACITRDSIVFGSNKYMSPINGIASSSSHTVMNEADIKKANDLLFIGLSFIYAELIYPEEYDVALKYIKENYQDLLIPITNAPRYQPPPQYNPHSNNRLNNRTPAINHQPNLSSNNDELPPPYPRRLSNDPTN